MKYIDLIAYPIMMVVVYILIGLAHWNHDPAYWEFQDRCCWILWGLIWGYALQRRVVRGGIAW